MLNTNYALEMDKAFAGMLADLNPHTVDSYAAEEEMNAGQAVILGTDPAKQVMVADATGDAAKIIGIALHVHKELPAGNAKYYAVGDAVPVLTKGRVWVKVGDAVTAGKTANYKLATGEFVAESVTTGIEATTAVFKTSTSAAGIAEIEIG